MSGGGQIIPFPGVNMDKTAQDEQALLAEVVAMVGSGKDGVEAGLSTTEFWLTTTAVVIDVAGPHYGFLQGINAQEQGLIAAGLVIGYTALRSWRKRGGPAKLLAALAVALHGAPSPQPPSAPAAVQEAAKAA